MAKHYDFWVHGSDVNIEYPDRVDGHPRRAGWGTTLRQAGETDNWFHFAVPTPTTLPEGWGHDHSIVLEGFTIHGEVHEDARVDRVHAWDGHHRFFAEDGIRGLENQRFHEGFDVEREIDYGLNVCVHVEFDRSDDVTLNGAGGRFYTDAV